MEPLVGVFLSKGAIGTPIYYECEGASGGDNDFQRTPSVEFFFHPNFCGMKKCPLPCLGAKGSSGKRGTKD